jgi:prevent-host-death family protein
MQTVNISDLRANLLKYLEQASLGEKITVTTNGRLLATISPPIQQREIARKQLQQLALNAKIHNITDSLTDEWDALK